MNAHPVFVDNRDGNTLAQALGEVLCGTNDGVGESTSAPDQVRIATAFFNPTGFAQIADHLRRVAVVQLLLGADLSGHAAGERRRLDETEAMFERRRMHSRLREMDGTLRRERDQLPFSRTSRSALRKLIEALKSGHMEVRRFEKAFLHAKAYIFTAENVTYGNQTAS